jgi:hypothetical protein
VLVALGLFGGPVATPFRSPGRTVAAVAVWSVSFACGMLVSAGVLDPRDLGQDPA